jgi:hypothetical protein
MYINGARQAALFSGNIFSTAPGGTFTVGAAGSIYTNSLDGQIDAVALYSTRLAEDRILQHYQAGAFGYRLPPVYSSLIEVLDPILYYKLNEQSGTTAVDSSGNGNTGTYSGTPLLNQVGLFGYDKSISVSGTQSISSSSAQLRIYGDLTIFGWINLSSLPAESTIVSFGAVGSTAELNTPYSLSVLSDGSIRFLQEHDAGTQYVLTTSAGQIVAGQTYFLSVARDNISRSISIYKNGVVLTSGQYEYVPSSGTSSIFYVGSLGASNYVNGKIDDIVIFTRALSEYEIQYAYETAIAELLQNPVEFYDHALLSINESAPASSIIDVPEYWFRLDDGTGDTTNGTNILTENESLGSSFSIEFFRDSIGTWYNDNLNDSELSVNVFFKRQPGDISFDSGPIGYMRPIWTLNSGIKISLRKGLQNSSAVTTYVSGTPAVQTTTVHSQWTAVDLSGQSEIKISIKRSLADNTMSVQIRSDGVLRETIQTSTQLTEAEIADGVVLFHHHNYGAQVSNEDIVYLKIRSYISYAYESKVLSYNPMLYYKLDEVSGTTVADSVGNNDGFTANGVVTRGIAPLETSGLYASTINTGRIQTNDFNLALTELTLSFWVQNLNSVPAGYQCVAWLGDSRTVNGNFAAINILNGYLGIHVYGSNSTSQYQTTLVTGTKKHIALTVKSGETLLFVDGKVVARVQNAPVVNWLHFGQNRSSTEQASYSIDEIALFQTKLTLQQIRDLANQNLVFTSYSDAVLFKKPTIYYRMNEASGTTAIDSSGNGYNGTYGGSPVLQKTGGIESSAVEFDGTSAYVQSINGAIVNVPAFTSEAWINLVDTIDRRDIADNGNASGWVSVIGPGTGKVIVETYAGSWNHLESTQSIIPNQWYHIVVSRSGTGVGKIYINGVLDGQSSSLAMTLNSSTYLTIGKPYGQNIFYMKGLMDEYAFYNRELTSDEILENYSARIPFGYADILNGANLYYKLDETSGTLIDDSIGTNNGTLNGSALVSVPGSLPGISGTAIAFNGTNNYISTPYTRNFSREKTTIMFAIRGATGTDAPAVTNRRSSGIVGDLQVRIASDMKVEIVINHLGTVPYITVYRSTAAIQSVLWTHIAVTLDNVAKIYKIYINGILDSTHSANWVFTASDGNFSTIEIGRHYNYTFSQSYANASLDEVAIFDEVLTDTQVALVGTEYDAVVTVTNFTFTMPYNLGRIETLDHHFQFGYNIDQITITTDNFTFPYQLEREQLIVEHDFHLNYQLEQTSSVVGSATPFEVNMLTASINMTTNSFSLRWRTNGLRTDISNFRFGYQLKLDKTVYQFNLRYRSNREMIQVIYGMFKNTYSINLVRVNANTFTFRSRVDRIGTIRDVKTFNLRYKTTKGKVVVKEYDMPYIIEHANTFVKEFNIQYRVRLVPNELDTILAIDQGSLNLDIDVSQLVPASYKIIIDNGNRYLDYRVTTSFGQNITGEPINVEYAYTKIIPPYVPSGTEIEFLNQDVKYYDGINGWSQLSFDIEYGTGIPIFASALNSMPGPKPYSMNRTSHSVSVYNAGHYIFDYTTASVNEPILYLIENTGNRVIKMSSGVPLATNSCRLSAYLPIGAYTLVPASAVEADLALNAVDTTYVINAIGPDFGTSSENMIDSIINYGFKEEEIPDLGATFSVHSMRVSMTGIDIDSSVSWTILNMDLSSIGTKFRSVIPREEMAEIGYSPDVFVMPGNVLRAKIKIPNSCCFANKLSIDDFETTCRVIQPEEEKKTYIANTKIVERYNFNFSFLSEGAPQTICSIEPDTIAYVNSYSSQIFISRDLGDTWESAPFDTGQGTGIDTSVVGSGGKFITQVYSYSDG